MPVATRRELIKTKQGCFNCLSLGHMLSKCVSKSTCRSCGKRHHTFLHAPFPTATKENVESSQDSVQTGEPKSTASSNLVASFSTSKPSNSSLVLLGTAIIHIKDKYGQFHSARALLDLGSQVSFATESLVNRLSLPRHKFFEPISGICQNSVTNTRGKVNCVIRPACKNGRSLNVTAIILPKITAPLPTENLPPDVKHSFKNYQLADPNFHVKAEVDLLLGAELFSDIFDGGRQPTQPGLPTLHNTIFGWVLIGSTNITKPVKSAISTNLAILEPPSLESCLKQFWEIEEALKPVVQLSPEEQYCEQFFASTHQRDDTGRYIVRLPFCEQKPELGDSYSTAHSCLMHLERRFQRNPVLLQQYQDFMNDYESLGHMRRLKPGEDLPK